MRTELVRLAALIDWSWFERKRGDEALDDRA